MDRATSSVRAGFIEECLGAISLRESVFSGDDLLPVQFGVALPCALSGLEHAIQTGLLTAWSDAMRLRGGDPRLNPAPFKRRLLHAGGQGNADSNWKM